MEEVIRETYPNLTKFKNILNKFVVDIAKTNKPIIINIDSPFGNVMQYY